MMDFNNKVVCNGSDAVRNNGYVTQVSIACLERSEQPENLSITQKLICYVISEMPDTDVFQVVHQCDIYSVDITSRSTRQTFNINDSTLYLEQGQYLAIGLAQNLATPCCIPNGFHYSLDFNEVNKAYENNTTVKFIKGKSQIAISFHLIPTSGKFLIKS
jgi:hypothetical protein